MKSLLLTAASCVALLAGLPQAQSALVIWGNVGGTVFQCTDNQASCDTNNATGTLQLANQTINGVAVNTSIQTSTKGSSNVLNTSSTSLINTTAAPISINFVVGDTSFTGPVTNFFTSGAGTWQNADGSSITLNWFDDPTNTQGAIGGSTPGTRIDTFFDAAVGPADSFAHNGSGPIIDGLLFSMTEQAIGVLAGNGQLINRGQTEIKPQQAVPEPASLMIFGSALVGLGLMRRRRKTV